MGELKNLRMSKSLTQAEAAALVGISVRSYKTYENEIAKSDTLKYRYIVDSLYKYTAVDEQHGILSLEQIEKACAEVFSEYNVNYCILFGSYAKGKATEQSDVDLLISTDLTGLKFFGVAEKLRNALHKKVDLLDLNQLNNNVALVDEILKSGVKIYG